MGTTASRRSEEWRAAAGAMVEHASNERRWHSVSDYQKGFISCLSMAAFIYAAHRATQQLGLSGKAILTQLFSNPIGGLKVLGLATLGSVATELVGTTVAVGYNSIRSAVFGKKPKISLDV